MQNKEKTDFTGEIDTRVMTVNEKVQQEQIKHYNERGQKAKQIESNQTGGYIRKRRQINLIKIAFIPSKCIIYIFLQQVESGMPSKYK